MAWPNPSDYQEALQNPSRAFADGELQRGTVSLTRLGLPRPISGNFATVFEVTTGARKWAVRCFSREVSDQQQRYAAIHQYLLKRSLPYTAGFEFLPQGVMVRGRWYPVVKMEWVDGDQLDTFIVKNIQRPQVLQPLPQKWLNLTQSLRAVSIAHGDLQHGNIIVTPQGGLRLVDYDGMVIPALAGQPPQEIGHRHYQHPSRTLDARFAPGSFLNVDNFSAWVIGVSLALVCLDPRLWTQTGAGEDSLLFQEADYKQPGRSAALRLLQNHEDVRVREIGQHFMAIINTPSYLKVPPLSATEAGITRPSAREWMDVAREDHPPSLPEEYPRSLPEERSRRRPSEHHPRTAAVLGQGWLQDHLPGTRPAAPSAAPQPPAVPPPSGRQAAWMLSYAQTLDPLPKIQFSHDLILEEADQYLAERLKRSIFTQLIFSLPRFVRKRFQSYHVVQQKMYVQTVQVEAQVALAGAERDLRDLQAELDKLRTQLETERLQLQDDIDRLTALINDSFQREKDAIQTAVERTRSTFIAQQLALYAITPGAINGFGRVRTEALNAAGLFTAADITPQNETRGLYALYDVRGADPGVEWQKLVQWRQQLEHSMRHALVMPPSELGRIKNEHESQRREWMRIRDTRRAHLRIVEQRTRNDPQTRRLEARLQQAAQTVEECTLRATLAERELAAFSEITVEKLVKRIREVLSSAP